MKRDLAAFSGRTFDLLVVGGGIVGAAAAWDAALRGLRVALVEASDLGGGASWNSPQTVHRRRRLRLRRRHVLEQPQDRARRSASPPAPRSGGRSRRGAGAPGPAARRPI